MSQKKARAKLQREMLMKQHSGRKTNQKEGQSAAQGTALDKKDQDTKISLQESYPNVSMSETSVNGSVMTPVLEQQEKTVVFADDFQTEDREIEVLPAGAENKQGLRGKQGRVAGVSKGQKTAKSGKTTAEGKKEIDIKTSDQRPQDIKTSWQDIKYDGRKVKETNEKDILLEKNTAPAWKKRWKRQLKYQILKNMHHGQNTSNGASQATVSAMASPMKMLGAFFMSMVSAVLAPVVLIMFVIVIVVLFVVVLIEDIFALIFGEDIMYRLDVPHMIATVEEEYTDYLNRLSYVCDEIVIYDETADYNDIVTFLIRNRLLQERNDTTDKVAADMFTVSDMRNVYYEMSQLSITYTYENNSTKQFSGADIWQYMKDPIPEGLAEVVLQWQPHTLSQYMEYKGYSAEDIASVLELQQEIDYTEGTIHESRLADAARKAFLPGDAEYVNEMLKGWEKDVENVWMAYILEMADRCHLINSNQIFATYYAMTFTDYLDSLHRRTKEPHVGDICVFTGKTAEWFGWRDPESEEETSTEEESSVEVTETAAGSSQTDTSNPSAAETNTEPAEEKIWDFTINSRTYVMGIVVEVDPENETVTYITVNTDGELVQQVVAIGEARYYWV